MSHFIRVTVEEIRDDKVVASSHIIERSIQKVSDISELGFSHQQQIKILQQVQDGLLRAQSCYLQETLLACTKCGGKMHNTGNTKSTLHSVLTDHKVAVKRQRCSVCGWTSVPSIRSLFGTDIHPDLGKLQCEAACDKSYRQAQTELNRYSFYPRSVNNHEHLYRSIEQVGCYIAEHSEISLPDKVAPADELICQIDGGHLKSKEQGIRSFEAMTAVIYNPINVDYPSVKHRETTQKPLPPRGIIRSKHCAASALSDEGIFINKQTLLAANKQGMTKTSQLTVLCDGADNCWKVVDYLAPYCGEVIRILDWFHIAMRFENIRLPESQAKKLEHIKWCFWHNKIEEGLERLLELSKKVRKKTMKTRLEKLHTYLTNNRDYLCHYKQRYENKKVISSSLAESTVESLINQRCKGKQHMKWSRAGAHTLLQVRACRASNDWIEHGRYYVQKALENKTG